MRSGWLVRTGPQDDEGSVVEQGVTVAGDRRGDLLADHVVREQQGASFGAGVEGEQHVFAVGGADGPLELQAGRVRDRGVEGPDGAGAEAVATGKDDAFVVR